MRIKKRDLQRLIEALLFENQKRPRWNYSDDSDWPAAGLKTKDNKPGGKKFPVYDELRSKRVLLLRDQDTYTKTGMTHGGESHSIKHLVEMDPELVADYMRKAIEILRKEMDGGRINKDIKTLIVTGNPNDPQPSTEVGPIINIDDVTLGDMLNTVDQIYDESIDAAANDADPDFFVPGMMNILDPFSNKIMALLDEMNSSYDNVVDDVKATAIDVSDSNLETLNIKDAQDLLNWFAEEHRVIMFMGEFRDSGSNEPMFLRTIDTAYVGNSGGKVSTLMIMKKKPPSNWNQVFGPYGNVLDEAGNIAKDGKSHTQIDRTSYSIFREMCDGLKNKTLNLPDFPKK